MGRPIKKTDTANRDVGYKSGYGATIGKPFAVNGVYTIDFQFKDASGTLHNHGYASKQRNKHRFDLADSSTFGNVTTVRLSNNSPANLTANTASVLCYNTSNVAFYAKELQSTHVTDWAGNRYVYKINTVATANWANVALN